MTGQYGSRAKQKDQFLSKQARMHMEAVREEESQRDRKASILKRCMKIVSCVATARIPRGGSERIRNDDEYVAYFRDACGVYVLINYILTPYVVPARL